MFEERTRTNGGSRVFRESRLSARDLQMLKEP